GITSVWGGASAVRTGYWVSYTQASRAPATSRASQSSRRTKRSRSGRAAFGRCTRRLPRVEIALEDEHRGDLVHRGLAVPARHAGRGQRLLRDHGREALVPGDDRHRHGASEGFLEGRDLLGLGAERAVEPAGQPDDHLPDAAATDEGRD